MRGDGPATGPLWALLDDASIFRERWDADHDEASRVAMVGAWDIWITCTGAGRDVPGLPGTWERCTPTVLSRNTGDDDNHLAYRGACLGCGWVGERVHLLWEGGENAAAADANDHTHPGWRDLPVVARPPSSNGGSGYAKAVTAWRSRWEPFLPGGWLERGGPIRTRRGRYATRHVPGGCPGGGYDMSADDTAVEAPGGQLGLF